MSAARKHHEPGCNHQTPARDSKGWIRIIERGCGGHMHETSCGQEFDCDHGYTWNCEECPVGIVSMEIKEVSWKDVVKMRLGPPRPSSTFLIPDVATELILCPLFAVAGTF